MSRDAENARREELLQRMAEGGRALSDAAVMFHTALAKKLELGPSDWKMLGLLEQYGEMSAGDLAERSGLAPPSVTGILDRLERRGWIRREKHPDDRRRVVIDLERAALVDVGALFGGLTRRLNQLYADYSDEDLEQLADFMLDVARCQREATEEIERAD